VKGKRPQICLWQVGTDGCELAPRPRLGAKWNTYEKFVVVDQEASQVQLVLHADVGERLLGRTVTDYRNVTIEAMDAVAKRTLWPAQIPHTRVTVADGEHELAIVGGMSGSAIAEFEPLQDCFRYDDQTQKEAGLAAETEGDPDNPTFTLKAREHMACLGATVPDMGASSLYEFSLEAKSIALRDPKFCLYLRGPDACEKLPTAGPWEGWTHYQTLVGPNDQAVETRVYLYGLRDLTGEQQSEVAYRDVKLRPVASTNSVVMVREPAGGDDALSAPRSTRVSSASDNPIMTSFVKPPGPTIIGFIEGYAPGWQLAGAEHIMLEGWMNGWVVAEDEVKGTLLYRPARIAGFGLIILPIAIVLAIMSIWLSRRRTRRLRAEGKLP
jgi:arabinofuranan 3-O-arabinosyltransferase